MGKFLTLLLLVLLGACQSESRQSTQAVLLLTPSGEKIRTRLAITPLEQMQGLSGVQDADFAPDEGMLFFNLQDGERNFWMPDTYFDLDIHYLDRELRITDIVRRLPHHKGRLNEAAIPRARPVWARHALEMKASSAISAGLKIGDQLRWDGSFKEADAEARARAEGVRD